MGVLIKPFFSAFTGFDIIQVIRYYISDFYYTLFD